MKQNYAIIGLGRFGGSICRTLVESGQEVLAIDSNEERVNEYMNIATHAVVGNAQDEGTLRSLGIRNFDHVIVAIGEDIQASILVTLMVKEMGVPNVLAKAQNEYHAKVLERVGADRVVHPERDMGVRIAHNLVSRNILDFIDISKRSYQLLRQNLFWAFFYNLCMIPVAMGLFSFFGMVMNPMIGSIAMTFSSLTVVLNSLRLGGVKRKWK